jgi:hypothetical protein
VAEATELVASLEAQPWGQISPSVYETARLVSLAPWLPGQDRRIEFLLGQQRPGGEWGGPAGYALVPTLSATEALMTVPDRARESARAKQAVDRALGWLVRADALRVPDTPAVELVVPALVEALNARLDERLPLPAGSDDRMLGAIRRRLAAGSPVPEKLLHSLEVAGDVARGAGGVVPVPPGTVGASPAATAAWLVSPRPSVYLETVVDRYRGLAPSVVPITVFERAWVLSQLALARIHPPVSESVTASLSALLGPAGTPGGPGLPNDADTTSVVLLTLARLGIRCEPDCLWEYETDTHFCTWPGERTASTTVNAHVLDAVSECLSRRRPSRGTRSGTQLRAAARKAFRWLCGQQQDDGSWTDKWHASPYYATQCCALALHAAGANAARPSVSAAVRWVLETQQPDGGWGVWSASAEETAYAMQVLLLTGSTGARIDEAVARGYRYLVGSADRTEQPALWHDKDLYCPTAIVRAAVLAGTRLAEQSMGSGVRTADRVGVQRLPMFRSNDAQNVRRR